MFICNLITSSLYNTLIILYQKVLVITSSVSEEIVVLYPVCCVMYSVWYLFFASLVLKRLRLFLNVYLNILFHTLIPKASLYKPYNGEYFCPCRLKR